MSLKKQRSRRERNALTWVDFLLLAVLLASLFFAWRYLRLRRAEAAPDVGVRYLLCVSGIDTRVIDETGGAEGLIPIGDDVKSANGTAFLGRVSAVWTETHVETTVQNGAVVFQEVPHRANLYVEVCGDAVARGGDGLRISDIRIAAGEVGDYRIGVFFASGAKVISVRKESQNEG